MAVVRRLAVLQVYSVVHGVLRLELHAVGPAGSFAVNHQLIALNYADRADESYVSEVPLPAPHLAGAPFPHLAGASFPPIWR